MAKTKDRHVEILTHKINQLSKKIANMEKLMVCDEKIEKLEAEKSRYIAWRNQITNQSDY
jgi:prefoldin subunit 5